MPCRYSMMSYYSVLICLIAGIALAGGQKILTFDQKCGFGPGTILSRRVTGGIAITADQAPWNVVIERKDKTKPDRIWTYCGGNILSPRVVLTAAHCLWHDRFKARPGDINVYVGLSSISPKNVTALVVKDIILHEKWNKEESHRENIKRGHDIAILEMEDEMEFGDDVQPICLPSDDVVVNVGTSVTVNGFGKAPYALARHLQSGDMEIKDKESCISAWSKIIELSGDQVCAISDSPLVDTCKGDSGGGLVLDVYGAGGIPISVVVGICSFGQSSCLGGRPGVYTNVLSHVHWIEQKILDVAYKNGVELILIKSEGRVAEYAGGGGGGYFEREPRKYKRRPVYQQKGNGDFIFHSGGSWWVCLELGDTSACVLRSPSTRSTPPPAGWLYADDRGWRKVDDTFKLVLNPRDVFACSIVTLASGGVAGRRWPRYMGRFTWTGDWIQGRKLYSNGETYLRVPTNGTSWGVGEERDSLISLVASGRATTCPCSDAAGPSDRNGWTWWQYHDEESQAWQVDPDIRATCH